MKRVRPLVAAAMMTLALAGCAVYGGPYGASYYDSDDYYPYGYYSNSYPYGSYGWGHRERHEWGHREHGEEGHRDHRD